MQLFLVPTLSLFSVAGGERCVQVQAWQSCSQTHLRCVSGGPGPGTSTSTFDQGGMIQGLGASPHCHVLSSPNLTLERKGNPNVNPFKHISNHAIPFPQSLRSTPQQAACENSILLIPIGQDGTVPAASS